MRKALVLLPILLLIAISAGAQDAYKQLRGIIHLDSTVSGGDMDPEEMIRYLIENGLEVAIFSDHITVRVEYGAFPARWIMGWLSGQIVASKMDRAGSVTNYGPANYVALLEGLDKQYEDIIVIPGVEAIPFYHWEGSLLKGELTMINGYKHVLAFGFDGPEDYTDLPSVGEGFLRAYGVETALSLWPLILLYFSYRCFKARRGHRGSGLYRVPGLLFLVIGLAFLAQNFPYKFGRFDQYHGDQGVAPYQAFIDYVNSRNGLVFWAHPEVSSETTYFDSGFLKIKQKTEAPYRDLLYLHNYTGFGAFYEGMKYMIPPGGIWDQVLNEHCVGLREQPVWAIAEADLEGDSFSPKLSQTVFMVTEPSKQEVFQSLRDGRIYAVVGDVAEHLSLSEYVLSGPGNQVAGMGETLRADPGPVTLKIRVQCARNKKGNSLKALLIRDGEVVREYSGRGTLRITYRDDLARDGRMHYYRLHAEAPGQSHLLTNPIFARATGSP